MQCEKLKGDSVSWRITEMDRYLGTALQWLNSVILIIWMIVKGVSGTGILLEKYHTLSENLILYGQVAGILLAAFLMVYFLFGVGAFLTEQYGLGRRMMGIAGISVLGTGVIWRKNEIPVAALVQVFGICLVIMGIYFIQIYSNNKAQKSIFDFNEETAPLIKCKSDKVYVPLLLNTINNNTLKTRLANEVYTYVYGAYKYKRRHYTLLILSIFFPAAVTALSGSKLIDSALSDKIVPILSMFAVIVSGIFCSFKAKESWSRYREYAEKAKNEIFCFAMKLGEYKIDSENEREKKLAEKMEALFMEEGKRWKEEKGKEDK